MQRDPQGNLGRIVNIASNHRNPSHQTCNNADFCQHIAVLKLRKNYCSVTVNKIEWNVELNLYSFL